MKTPFENDPFAFIMQAFGNLYPDEGRKLVCHWVAEITEPQTGNVMYSVTTFGDDGTIYIDVSIEVGVRHAFEILVHELAHVAVRTGENHGEAWEAAVNAIYEEYDRIVFEKYPDEETEASV